MLTGSSVIIKEDTDRRTRQRLLEVAGEVFAEQGFRRTTVREICGRANANVAAINYYFGDKRRLYSAAVKYAHDYAKRYPLDAGLPDDAEPRQRLHAFVGGFVRGILEEGRPAWHGRLMAREMSEPTGVLDEIVAQSIRPRFELLASIVRSVVGNQAPAELVQRCAQSVVAQILFYHFAGPVLNRLFPDSNRNSAGLDALADHITTFSLAGMRAFSSHAKQGGPP